MIITKPNLPDSLQTGTESFKMPCFSNPAILQTVHVHAMEYDLFGAWHPITYCRDVATGHFYTTDNQVFFGDESLSLDCEPFKGRMEISNASFETCDVIAAAGIRRMIDKSGGEQLVETIHIRAREGLVERDYDTLIDFDFAGHCCVLGSTAL